MMNFQLFAPINEAVFSPLYIHFKPPLQKKYILVYISFNFNKNVLKERINKTLLLYLATFLFKKFNI